MAEPRTYQVEAVILRGTDSGEADRILLLYTLERGKMRALARGVRKIQSRMRGYLQPFSHCFLLLAKGRSLDIVTQVWRANSFFPFLRDPQRLAAASYLTELIDAFTPEEMQNPPLFRLLLRTLFTLCKVEEIDILLRYFEMGLLRFCGFDPELWRCVNCGREIKGGEVFFSASGGGLLCGECRDTEIIRRPISFGALEGLRRLREGEAEEVGALRLPSEVKEEIRGILREYIEFLASREFKTLRFLEG